jgi:hypothetical protein
LRKIFLFLWQLFIDKNWKTVTNVAKNKKQALDDIWRKAMTIEEKK